MKVDKTEIETWICILWAIAYPTKYFTMGNDRKWVRILGEIGLFIPMFPWTVITSLLLAVGGLTIILIAGLYTTFAEWYREV